jgi:ubiquinone/menaquinone biosynthesis C-methylase UbiE
MTTVADAPALASFSDVDTESDAASLIGALDEQAAIPAIQRLRAAATDLLRARLGHELVDVGCGTGDLARALAGRVGPTGTVLGIDASETMLTEARRRAGTTTLPVEFRQGDVTNLDLDDARCDGIVCERVFQHLASPHTAMAELVRVTRPGGQIVVLDTDWGLHAIHGADPTLTATIVNSWAANAANGLAGRQLPALFADAGLRDPIVIAETMTTTDPARPSMPPFTTMAAAVAATGAISAADAHAWLDQLADAGRRGRFFWALTMFAVASHRPAPDHETSSSTYERNRQ